MGDFQTAPAALPLSAHTGLHGPTDLLASIANNTMNPPGTTTTWVANLISYCPVAIPFDFPVRRAWWINGSTITSTNVEFGIYTWDGVKVWSSGSVAMSVAADRQYATPTTAFILPAGKYYFAWTCNNTLNRGATFVGSTALAGAICGMLEETPASFGLPASMTPVRWTRGFGPSACGLTRTSSGF